MRATGSPVVGWRLARVRTRVATDGTGSVEAEVVVGVVHLHLQLAERWR